MGRVGLELPSQRPDREPQIRDPSGMPFAPYRTQKLRVGQDLSGILGEKAQHGIRLRREFDLLPLAANTAVQQIDFEIPLMSGTGLPCSAARRRNAFLTRASSSSRPKGLRT